MTLIRHLQVALPFFLAALMLTPELYARPLRAKPNAKTTAKRQLTSLRAPNQSLLTAPKPKAPTRQWALHAELFGRGGYYSLNTEYSPRREFSFGAGFSYQSIGAMGVTADVITLPLFANYYFTNEPVHRFFASGGVTILSIQGRSEDISMKAEAGGQEANFLVRGMDLVSATLPIPNLGAGYEFAQGGGFLFRAQFLFLYTGQIANSAGLNVGYRF